MTRRLKTALNAGLVSFIATSFGLALFVTPLLAGHSDFGHVHSDSAPAHVHPIGSFFGSTPASAQPALSFTVLIGTALIDLSRHHLRPQRSVPLGSRAPPIAP